jgi:hypothetical protein
MSDQKKQHPELAPSQVYEGQGQETPSEFQAGPLPESVEESSREATERPAGQGISEAKGMTSSASSVASQAAVTIIQQADEELKLIEEVLSEGLSDIYKSLPQERKTLFRQKGEETARKIRDMVASVQVKASNILQLIISWLRLIPGVNRFFLKQEAKIKTDQILSYIKQKQQRI